MTKRKSSPVLSILNGVVIDLPGPSNISYLWNFGSVLGICLMGQIVTGVLLAMHYCVDVDMAFASVAHITRDVNNGHVLRYVHANGASLFFACVYVHVGKGLYHGGYNKAQVWVVGIALYVVMVVTAFMGYVLPWGQMSFWAATVITNLLSTIGTDIVIWVWGGYSVSNATLNRFYSLHYLLPFVLAALVAIHIIALHSAGSNNPVGVWSDVDKVPFHPYYVLKDLYGAMLFMWVLAGLAFIGPYALGDAENYRQANALVTPVHIAPEAYFLWVYAILRSIPNKLGGVLALVFSIVVLLVLPALHTSRLKGLPFRPIGRLLFWSLVADFALLTWIGGQPVEPPYVLVGQLCSTYYFGSFLVLGPIGGRLENWLPGAVNRC